MQKILIVEDDPSSLKLLKCGIENLTDDLKILTSCNGREAIDLLKREDISLLITDLQMPEVDGLELLSYVKNNYRAIPCVVVTAHINDNKEFELYVKALQPDIMELIKNDSIHFFSKPINVKSIFKTINRELEQYGLEGAVSGISVASFMQIIEMEQKTCQLEINSQIEEKGIVHFVEGIPYNASYGFLTGEEAVCEIINIEKPKIHIKYQPSDQMKAERQVNKSLNSLLLEAMRLKDESR